MTADDDRLGAGAGEEPELNGYADAYGYYHEAGWPGVLKLKRGTKTPPAAGYTGRKHERVYPSAEVMEDWARAEPDGNLALRLPPYIIGLDVDAYGDKTGGQTLKEAERRWGELPPTWISGSRLDDDTISGIRLYRVPDGIYFNDEIEFKELGVGGIDIIQHHHRYVVACPSIHPEKRVYGWRAPDGTLSRSAADFPLLSDIPELPKRWLTGLAKNPSSAETNGETRKKRAQFDGDVGEIIAECLTPGEPDFMVRARLADAIIECDGPSRHDHTCSNVLALLRMGKWGKPGVERALTALERAFVSAIAADRPGGEAEAQAEFVRYFGEGAAQLLSEPNGQCSDEDAVLEDPIPLTQTFQIPEFPVDALPKAMADMVRGVAEATQTDLAMAGTSSLGAIASCTGGHAEIEIRSGWREPLCIYTVTIADSGERKSSVQQALVRPIYDVERDLAAAGVVARAETESLKQIALDTAKRRRKEAASAKEEQRETAVTESIRADALADGIEIPVVPRIVADDITPESLGSVLAEQKGRLAIISAEGGVFDIIGGRYSNNVPNVDVYLKGHSGDPLRVDRKGKPPEYVARPALTMSLMIQPVVLTNIAGNRVFRGRGLLARILYAYPVSKVGHRKINASPLDVTVKDRYEKSIRDLASGLAEWLGDPAVLTLTEEAKAEVVAIEAEIEPTLAGDGELAPLADWGSKYVGAIVRIAGLLHLAENGAEKGPTTSVSGDTMKKARRLGEYFKACAIQAFAKMGLDEVTADAIYLLDRIERASSDELSVRDMQRVAQRFHTKSKLMPAVARLVDHGYLVPLSVANQTEGRPSSPRYRIVKCPRA